MALLRIVLCVWMQCVHGDWIEISQSQYRPTKLRSTAEPFVVNARPEDICVDTRKHNEFVPIDGLVSAGRIDDEKVLNGTQREESEETHRKGTKPPQKNGPGSMGARTGAVPQLLSVARAAAKAVVGAARSVGDKARHLRHLQRAMLLAIQERLEARWPDEGQGRRVRRGAGGHVSFPSAESALLSISFLTFAVFLVKLVLQVIQAYKNKAGVMPVLAAVGRAPKP